LIQCVPEAPSNDDIWRGLLTGEDSPIRHQRTKYRRLPGSPRCKQCLVPLGGPMHPIVRFMTKKAPSRKNPNYCDICERFVASHPGGVEIEVTLLFADVRGSTALAERTSPAEFHALLNRFYGVANKAVIASDGLVDKFVGDEVVALYLPIVGPEHPQLALRAAVEILEGTGHRDPEGPWVPVGVGVHTGSAYVGAVGSEHQREFTALGDAVNVAARLASFAGAGEVLVTEDAYARGGGGEATESRSLELRGKTETTDVRVVHVAPRAAPAAAVAAPAE
jgi:adenylate cyclase